MHRPDGLEVTMWPPERFGDMSWVQLSARQNEGMTTAFVFCPEGRGVRKAPSEKSDDNVIPFSSVLKITCSLHK